MNRLPRRYLDNAATSWPKPAAVYAAVDDFQRRLGAPAGRSTSGEAEEVERRIRATRRQLAALIGVADPARVVFCANGTDALNQAMLGLLQAGDHVVTSILEHNSVLRPLHWLEEHRGVQVTRVSCGGDTLLDPQDVIDAITPRTKLIVLIHASNVTGAIQPLAEIGSQARQRGVCFLVDAAQSVGHWPVDAAALSADMLAAPTHKGLLGPLGGGFLYLGPGMEHRVEPLRLGGTGTLSDSDRQPTSLPDRYESGNPNVPAILGLGAGLQFLGDQGLDNLIHHERALAGSLAGQLAEIRGVRVWGPARQHCMGVVSVTIEDYDPREAAVLLDAQFGVQVRSGYHCAPGVHQLLKVDALGGTVRFSVGAFNTEEDIEAAVSAVRKIALA